MAKKKGLTVVRGRGNVFSDLGHKNADVEQVKTILAAKIIKALNGEGLTVRAAHDRTGTAAADFSRIRNANLGRFTIDRLMSIAARLGCRVELKGQQMQKTRFEGQDLPHRFMWSIVEEQAAIANEREQDWSRPALVAMVFAFHTLEAYLNFVGEKLAPDVWKDEREFFRKAPYRGWDGKLRKVMDLVGLSMLPSRRPLKTILELKKLRDSIAHGKPEKLTGEIYHPSDAKAPYPDFTLRSMFTPKGRMKTAVRDVEKFIEELHGLAEPRVNDVWFGGEALRGPLSYSSREGTL